MTQIGTSRPADVPRGFLFAPSSRYPDPVAFVVDDGGRILHRWSNATHQPDPADDPPNNLKGWNHVAVDTAGNLYVTVPLRALLKLRPDSTVAWSCDIAAHHDLALRDDGVLALAEQPRRVSTEYGRRVILDGSVTVVDGDGAIRHTYSVYDMLSTDPGLRRLIDGQALRRARAFQGHVHKLSPAERELYETASYEGELRQALRLLRGLPGSPSDVLHPNTLALVGAHPDGLWKDGDVLLCMRDLDTVAVVSLADQCVRWWWGPDELSGPHQPSMQPDGRILVYDNGVRDERTRLVMVDPRTGQIDWTWTADPPESFFCPLAGGVERLPDGNLLVTDSTGGGAFELTPQGREVWRLRLPVEAFGRERGRVSIYRMAAVSPEVIAKLPPPGDVPTGKSRHSVTG